MFSAIRAFFSAHTVDSLIADIVQKVEHLHAVAEVHAAEQAAQAAVIAEAQAAKAFAEKEYDRAKAIAAKLTALVS